LRCGFPIVLIVFVLVTDSWGGERAWKQGIEDEDQDDDEDE
jgi:hypothetical protein